MSLLTTLSDSLSYGERRGGDALWLAEPESGASPPHQYSLMAGQGVPVKGS